MNIGMVNEYFPPFAPGGAEWSTLFLAQRLARSQRVVIITPNYGAAPREEMDGVIVERFAFPFRLREGQRLLSYGYLANPVFYAYSALQVVLRVKKYHLEILHAHNKQSLVGTILAGWLTGVPVVVSLRDWMVLCRYGMCLNEFDSRPHGCDLRSYRRCVRDYLDLYMPDVGTWRRTLVYVTAAYHRLDTALKQAMLRRASAIIALSDKMRQIYISRGMDARRMLTIYNPLPPIHPPQTVQGSQKDHYQILYAGKLSWGKGPHLLIEALPAIRTALTDRPVRLTLAGQGPLRAHLEQRVTELELGEQVTFVGQLSHDQLRRLYAEADVVVVPSVWQEPFGRVALESLMCGTPVVASSRGGLREIVEDGVTGFVVEPRPDAIGDAVIRVLQDPGMRVRVQDSLPALKVKFGSDVPKTHLDLYTMLLAGQFPEPSSERD